MLHKFEDFLEADLKTIICLDNFDIPQGVVSYNNEENENKQVASTSRWLPIDEVNELMDNRDTAGANDLDSNSDSDTDNDENSMVLRSNCSVFSIKFSYDKYW